MSRKSAFRRLWLATTVSQLGTQVSELAIPFVAIVTMRATPFQVGLLIALEFAPILLFSLPAGVWVDRLRRRPLLIAGDLGRFGLLFSIPVAYALGNLSLAQLYIVAFAVGSLSVLFDVAYQAYLPSVVEPEHLTSANSRLQISEQSASVVGPALGGSLISLLTAPFAVVADAVSYLFSAVLVGSIGVGEPSSPGRGPKTAQRSMIREIGEGLRYVLWHPILRPLVMTPALTQLFGRMVMAVLLIYLVRQAGLSPAAVGTVLSIGSVGFVLGAVIAPWVSRRLGLGRAMTLAAVIASLGPLFYALGPPNLAGVFVAAGFFLYGVAALTWSVNALSLRQAVTPPGLLGRTSATMRMVSWGAIPLGSLAGGLLGGALGLRETIVIGAAGTLAASLPVIFSSVPQLRSIKDAVGQPAAVEAAG